MMSRILFTPMFLGCILMAVVINANQTTDQFREDVSGIMQMPSEENPRGFHLAKESFKNNTTCLKEFNSKNTLLLRDLKKETISCTETAYQMKRIVRANQMKIRSKILEDIRKIFEKCDNVEGHFEYENCSKNILNETHFEKEVERRTAELSQEFQNIDKAESDCFKKNIDQSKIKSELVFCNLHHCLLGDSEPTLQHEEANRVENITSNDSILTGISVPLNFEKCLQHDLERLKEAYKNLKTCVAEKPSQFNNCMEEAKKLLKHLKSRLKGVSAMNSEEINTFDKKGNTCFRHFITEIIFPDFSYASGLENCFKQPFKEPALEEHKQVNLINAFRNLQNALRACRADEDKEKIRHCISETLSNSEELRFIDWSVQRIPEETLKDPKNKVYEVFSNKTDCVGNILEKIKFRGLFMSYSAIKDYTECMNKRYILNIHEEPPTTKDCITKLESIETSLIKCTDFPVGPMFSKCVSKIIESSSSSLTYIERHQFPKSDFLSSKGLKFGAAYEGHFFKCLGEILDGYNEKSCSSSSSCSYRNIERCILWTFPSRFNKKPLMHQDEYTLVYQNWSLGGIKENVSFTLTGYILPNCENFRFNLILDHPTYEPEVALQINPRLPENKIVVNSWIKYRWTEELTYSILPFFSLHRGSKFTIQVLLMDKYYKIAVNGNHLTDYKHIVNYKSLAWLEVKGDVEVISVERSESSIYPKPFSESESLVKS